MHKRKTPSTEHMASMPTPLLTISQVAAMLSIGRTKVYELIKRDGLPVVKLGDATRVSVHSLAQWIAQHEQAS